MSLSPNRYEFSEGPYVYSATDAFTSANPFVPAGGHSQHAEVISFGTAQLPLEFNDRE